MGFIEGFVVMLLDPHGNSIVGRITKTEKGKQMYGIDTERVSDVNIFHQGVELSPVIERTGGKTVVQYETKTNGWLGMTYMRENFADEYDDSFSFQDSWSLVHDVVFVLVLPHHAVIASDEGDTEYWERYDADGNLVLSERTGGELQINLTYTKDIDTYQTLEFESINSSTFPAVKPLLSEFENNWDEFDDTKTHVDRTLSRTVEGIDWTGRAYVVDQILSAMMGGIG